MNRTRKKRKLKIVIPIVMIVLAAVSAFYYWFENGHSFMSIWLTPDQQGRYYFDRRDYATAAERFQEPLWKGVAYYRSKNFDAAVEQFTRVDTIEGYFNLGDAYAHLGQLEQAVTNYDEVLRRKPKDKAARENRDLVISLIQKNKKAKKEEEPPEGQQPIYKPDEIKFDEKGKKGKKGEIDQVELSAEQIQQMWMRRLQTTPSDFLRLKFAAQVEESRTSIPQGKSRGGK